MNTSIVDHGQPSPLPGRQRTNVLAVVDHSGLQGLAASVVLVGTMEENPLHTKDEPLASNQCLTHLSTYWWITNYDTLVQVVTGIRLCYAYPGDAVNFIIQQGAGINGNKGTAGELQE